MISKKENDIWLLEVKVQNNDETVLRCVLEIATYYQLLNKSSFIKSYSELSCRSILDIRKGILVAKCSIQEKELDKMKKGDSKHLNKLMEILQVAAFTIDGDNNIARI